MIAKTAVQRKYSSESRPLGFWSVCAIGVGGMVGGGIFAVLGLSIKLAQGGAPLAFGFAGFVALITAYSYAKLSVTYPSQGGTVEFIRHAFGNGLFSNTLNVLLCLSYVIMLSLYAYAFGSYAASFFLHDSSVGQSVLKHIFISLVVIFLAMLNAMGAKVVGRSELIFVIAKVIILAFFIIVGCYFADFRVIHTLPSAPPLKLIAGGMLIFLAYEGFELIANSAQDVKSPAKTLPRAYYSAVIFVIVLYVSIALITISTLDLPDIIAAKDYALAASAKPFLGEAGFMLIAFAALLSTGSAINATFYGTSRIIHVLAHDKELPAFLESKTGKQPIEGLLLMAGLTLCIANGFDLSSIAMAGSAGFLIVFIAVNLANCRLHRKTHSSVWISFCGAVTCAFALFALLWEMGHAEPYHNVVLMLILFFSFFISIGMRFLR